MVKKDNESESLETEQEVGENFVRFQTTCNYMLSIFMVVYGSLSTYLSLQCLEPLMKNHDLIKVVFVSILFALSTLNASMGGMLLFCMIKDSFSKKEKTNEQ